MSQTGRNVAEDGDGRLGFTLADTVRDGGGEDYERGDRGISAPAPEQDNNALPRLTNDETMPETTEKERRPPKLDITIPSPLQPPLDEVKSDETGHPERRVDGGEMQILQRVDDDLEGLFPGVQALGDPEQGGNLSGGDYKEEGARVSIKTAHMLKPPPPDTHY